MELGSLEIQIFVSLVVVLGTAFVALVCDFLKGNNEQLRERNVELRVRQDERERLGLFQHPLQWLQGLVALGRNPDAANALQMMSGQQPQAPQAAPEAAASQTAEPSAFAGLSELSRPATVPAAPAETQHEAPVEAPSFRRKAVDDARARQRISNWASKEELEQLAGRAARIRARHEAAQPEAAQFEIATGSAPPAEAAPVENQPVEIRPIDIRSSSVAAAETTTAPELPLEIVQVKSTAEEPPIQMESSSPPEPDLTSAPPVEQQPEPIVAEVKNHDEVAPDVPAETILEPVAAAQTVAAIEPEIAHIAAEPLLAVELAATVVVPHGDAASVEVEALSELVSSRAESSIIAPEPVTEESPELTAAILEEPVSAISEAAHDELAAAHAEPETLQTPPPVTVLEEPVERREPFRPAVFYTFADPVSTESSRPAAETVAPGVLEAPSPIEASHQPEALEEAPESWQFLTDAEAVSTDEPAFEPISVPLAPVAEQIPVPDSRWKYKETVPYLQPGPKSLDVPVSEGRTESLAEASTQPDVFKVKVLPIDINTSDRFEPREDLSLQEELQRVAAIPPQRTEITRLTWDTPQSAGPEPVSADPPPPPVVEEPAHALDLEPVSYESANDDVPSYPQIEIPSGLHEAAVLSKMLETQTGVFSGVVVAVGINDYEALREKLQAGSGNDSMSSLNRMILSILRPQDFACRFLEDEFIMLYPGESGATAQRRLFQVSEKLWDFQLRSLGHLSVMFSWGGLEVTNETLAESVASARERMYQTKRNRGRGASSEFGIARKRVVNG